MSRGTAGTRASGRRGLTGWVPQTHAGFGPCRYRCLVSLQHNLPASGDMCVSVLSRLCTITPNMYRVGVSKVSATGTRPLGAPRLEPVGSETLRLQATVPEAIQSSW